MPNVGLLPVTRDPNQLITYIEENFRRIAAAMALPTPAASVTPGAFPTGAFTIDGNLTVTGKIAAGGTASDPEPLTTNGGSSGISMKDRDNANLRWVIYPTANQLWFWDGANRVSFDRTTGLIKTNNAALGPHPVHNTYAWFGHRDMAGSTQYGFIQDAGGNTLVNATGTVYIRRNGVANTNELRLDASGLYVSDDIALPTNTGIWLKGPWDGTHRIYHDSGDDGFRYSSWNYHRFYMGGAEQVRFQVNYGLNAYGIWFRTMNNHGHYFEAYNTGWWCNNSVDLLTTYDHGIMRARRDTHQSGGGSWGTAGVRTEGTAGSGDKGVAFHRDGDYAFTIYLGGDRITRYNGSDGAWNRQDGNWFNPSSRKIKRDIYELEPGGLKKIMQLKPKKFKYKGKPEDVELWEKQAKEGRWGTETQIAKTREFRDREYAGFIAEELAEVYPEAVGVDENGEPSGYKDSVLAALMVQAVQELTEKVETLETTIAMQRNKK